MQDAEFTQIYRTNAQLLYTVALSYLKNAAEAEDAVTDVFMQLLESDIVFPDANRTRAWLVKSTQNRCKNLLRSWVRQKRVSSELMEQLAAEDSAPELNAVMAALLALPERYRMPLLLFAVEGYSIRETAEMLSLNESTVRTRIARAREKIRTETGVERA